MTRYIQNPLRLKVKVTIKSNAVEVTCILWTLKPQWLLKILINIGNEGKAGMAALVLKGSGGTTLTDKQLAVISHHSKENLAPYARPRFLRVSEELELTGTYKQRKMALVRDGFDLDKVGTALYYLDCKTQEYKLMDQETYRAICDGKIGMWCACRVNVSFLSYDSGLYFYELCELLVGYLLNNGHWSHCFILLAMPASENWL